jgi:hypothetical protein
MKRSILTLSFFILAIGAWAQDTTGVIGVDSVQVFQPSWAVKWNPVSLGFGKISLFAEYHFKNRRSLSFHLGIPVEISTKWKIEGEKRKVTMKSFSAMAGYRMYLKKADMQGLYFEPYLKYTKSEGSSPYVDQLSTSKTPYLLRSDYSGGGVGGQLGIQFLIAKKLTLDLFFLGPEANISKWDISLQDQGNYDWDAQDAAEALDILDNIIDDLPDFLSENVESSVDASTKTVTAKYKGLLPGVRCGFSIGFRF